MKKFNIFYIHGFGDYKTIADSFFKKIKKQGHNVHTFDLPNHGQNLDFSKQFLISDYCKYVTQYINSYRLQNVIVIGHSMGGAILSIIAHKIKSLQCVILWDPANPSLTPKERSSVRQSIKNKTNPITKFDWFTGNTKINKAWDPYKLSLDIFGEKCNLTIAKNLKRINVPIFVIFGDYDEIVPFEPSKKWFINFFKNKKDFEFITIKNASHSPWKTHLRQLIISFNHCLKKIT